MVYIGELYSWKLPNLVLGSDPRLGVLLAASLKDLLVLCRK